MPGMVSGILKEAGERLTTLQGFVLSNNYQNQTGATAANLASKPYTVSTSSEGASMQVNYLATMRFLDLKKTKFGKKKKRYAPIYNKYVYGFLMGFTYNKLREGISDQILDRGLTTTTINIKL